MWLVCWYYGPADFRHWLLEKADGVLAAKTQGKSRQNYQAEEIAAHHEAIAQRLLDEGLSRLGWDEKRLRSEASESGAGRSDSVENHRFPGLVDRTPAHGHARICLTPNPPLP